MSIPFIASPNYRKGRGSSQITHVVIHTMDGFYTGTQSWFQNPKSQVSAHYLVGKKGQMCQMVKEENKAWHVGNANPFTIGIELEDASWTEVDPKTNKRKLKGACARSDGKMVLDPNWYTVVQLSATAELVADICHRYKIPVKRVIGHNDPLLRSYGNNHQDPGPVFPWEKFRQMVQRNLDAKTVHLDALVPTASAV